MRIVEALKIPIKYPHVLTQVDIKIETWCTESILIRWKKSVPKPLKRRILWNMVICWVSIPQISGILSPVYWNHIYIFPMFSGCAVISNDSKWPWEGCIPDRWRSLSLVNKTFILILGHENSPSHGWVTFRIARHIYRVMGLHIMVPTVTHKLPCLLFCVKRWREGWH